MVLIDKATEEIVLMNKTSEKYFECVETDVIDLKKNEIKDSLINIPNDGRGTKVLYSLKDILKLPESELRNQTADIIHCDQRVASV